MRDLVFCLLFLQNREGAEIQTPLFCNLGQNAIDTACIFGFGGDQVDIAQEFLILVQQWQKRPDALRQLF
jgi:hypothetical protein